MIRLHLGAHKTASTHLQKALASATGGARSVCYLGPSEMRSPDIAAEALAAHGPSDPLGAEAAAAIRTRMTGAGHVLISEENILGTAHAPAMLREARFYPRAATRVANIVAGIARDGHSVTPVQLYLAVRDPAGFLVSAYCQRLYAGQVLSFEAFLGGLAPDALNWSDLVERLLTVPGVAGCVIWRYEDYASLLPRIGQALLPAECVARYRPGRNVVHPGLSAAAHAWVMAQADAGKPHAGLAREARNRWPKTANAQPFAPFGQDALRASATSYRADIAAIAELPGVTWLRPGDAPVAEA
jgi:hypothetical protein